MHALTRTPARWFPAALEQDADGTPTVGWLYGEETRFESPFLIDDMEAWARRPANMLLRHRTSLAELRALARDHPGLAPSGFVFHVSRCGSTLLSGLLGLAPGALSLSEPRLFDSIVRINDREPHLGREEQIETLRAAVSAMGRPRAPEQTRLFLKLDAWHLLHAPLIREAFPDTPWIFLYRDPLEVLVSQLRQRGLHMTPGFIPSHLLDGLDFSQLRPVEYCVRVLQALYAAGLEAAGDDRVRLLNYVDLPQALLTTVADHFGFTPDADFERAVAARTRLDAKRGGDFAPDAAEKRAEATEEAIRDCEAWASPVYARLEALRRRSAAD